MARYPVTQEGANQLLALAASLRATIQQLTDSTDKLNEQIESLNADSSSELLSEIKELARHVADTAIESEEPIEVIANKLTGLSTEISNLLGVGLRDSTSQTPSANSGMDGAPTRIGLTPGYGPYVSPKWRQRWDSGRRASRDELDRLVDPLPQTNEPLVTLANGGTRYDRPDQQANKLNWYQGLARRDYQGDCGLCAVQNIARMAGKNLSELDVVRMAIGHGLCETDPTVSPGERGGTDPHHRQLLLSMIGIPNSMDYNTDTGHIADLVESGRGVIVSVDVRHFWRNTAPYDQAGGHAVAVTSVDRDRDGQPYAFHICDSGLHDADYVVSTDMLRRSLRRFRPMNVTDGIIR